MAMANRTVELSFHKGSGNFCKTVHGRRFYLGKDHDEALETWALQDFLDAFRLRAISTRRTPQERR